MSASDAADFVAFIKILTDVRVRLEKAPFDHPSPILPHGHIGYEGALQFNTKTNQGA